MTRYALIGSGASARPVPKRMRNVIQRCLDKSGSGLNSCLRTQAAVNYARQHGALLSSQTELYQGYITGQPGYNPANPPGRSTHERRSDGVAYPGPVGRPLMGWQVGMDLSDSQGFIDAAKREGWICFRPYPVGSEWHHVNFRRRPIWPFKPLKRGSRRGKVTQLERRLKFLGYGKELKIDKHFGAKTQRAVKTYQRERGLRVDGVVGIHTWTQLKVDFRREWKRRK